ncbi:MAG: SRPBCC family protein [Alphaproteobacteria bacterium]|nr:SRPBCC family protein [Alphaproteobacteria bacterium]MBU1516497.1 SRPBCC family protein [Alphaproteobacteria bacterium]MBU2094254.1 SRPBCC family protein [Alphaproteobacteria bacterium]MBU2154169.1 SRPBCC family protein [Alphaproteobacteria bacterium]MBU2307424.1 SRPBCC family protein [Alphaproteobacteria bacterium]
MADVIHDTFVITRTYPKPPAEVFRAFSDAARKRRWFAGEGAQYESDFRVGGVETSRTVMGADTPFPGTPLTSEGRYLDIVPDSRIVMAATMAVGDRRISSALTTYELRANGDGTELVFTHQAAFFEGSDGPQMRRHGWEVILDRLAQALAN